MCGAVSAQTQPGPERLLTPEQRQWLTGKTLRFAPEQAYGPFVYTLPGGEPVGLSIDLLKLVQAHTGLTLQWQAAAPLAQLLRDARARRLDLLSSLRPTAERLQYLLFSQPYVSVPTVLVQREAGPRQRLADLAGQLVALGQGYAVEAEMRRRHPRVRWLPLPDDDQVLLALLQGQASAAVLDHASLAFISQARQLQGLQVRGPVGFDYRLSFAVRSDWPQLVDILNAGIAAITPAQRAAVVRRWMPGVDDRGTVSAGGWANHWGWGLLGVSALAAAGLAWRRRTRQP